MELWQFLGALHPKLVQFPLVLLLAGLVFDALGWIWKSQKAHWAGLACTGMGTIGLLFAFICGIYAEIWAGRAGIPQDPIELHELLANISSWGMVILFAWRLLLDGRRTADAATRRHGDAVDEIENQNAEIKNPPLPSSLISPTRRGLKIYIIIGLAWYGLLVFTGYLGGRLVFQYGAGATGLASGAGGVMSMEDLNILATRQTDENLRYSEWMHHIFGWMTLGLGVSLLAQALWPKQRGKFKWIVPVFLLAGGIFLFFAADLDLYRFTDWHQLRDREVQLHKTLAIIMATVGAVGLFKRKAPTGAPDAATRRHGDAAEQTRHSKLDTRNLVGTQSSKSNSILVAVLALIGGSMLFTHVHTVAPYANVAAGVYIAHVVMGLVALSIGATRLAQDYVRRAGTQKALALGFACFMLAEAILLITYNEGLPWYIGYGKYNRWGPNETSAVTIAPFGDFRAAMLIDQNTGMAFVAFRDRFTDDPVRLSLDDAPTLLVSRGYEETAIPLAQSPPQDSQAVSPAAASGQTAANAPAFAGSNFRGQADFLKTAVLVSARLVIHLKGERRVGYFDPWVTPLVHAIPQNEIADYVYQCPMHEWIRSKNAGDVCPLCGMPMVKIQYPRPAGVLHDATYQFRVLPEKADASPAPPPPFTGRFLLEPIESSTGQIVKNVALVHGQPIHLIVASDDLSYFDHIHPVPVENDPALAGSFLWQYTFPHAGHYILYADITPSGDRNQVFRIPLEALPDGAVKTAPDFPLPENHLALDEASGKLFRTIPAPPTPQDSAPWFLDPSPPAPWPIALAALPALPASPAELSPAAARPPIRTVQVSLIPQPRTLYAGLHTELVFQLKDSAGEPITDLAPYIGAMGHCVILSQDTADYLHCHPEQLLNPGPDDRGGPTVAFHAVFPRAGRYRIWGQFKRADGELIIAEFTLDVHTPPIPAGLIRFLLDE